MSCNNTNSTCTNCNHNYSSCNNKCAKCGCRDSFLTSPPPCPTPQGCPDPIPCQEVLSSDCVIYTGVPIMCDDVVIIPSDSTMTEALMALVDFMCGCCSGTHTPISYNCLTGVCFDPGDGTGIYPTLAACQTVCTDPTQPSWNCVNGTCINPGNGSGQYLSLSACQTACIPTPVTYNCVNGTCVNPGDGTGMYGTLAQCQQFCEDVYESYDCLNGVCSDPGDGSGVYPTLVACDAACTFPPPNISYNCLNGNCTDPGDGSGVYSTLLDCTNVCADPPQVSYNCFLGQCTDPGNGSGVYPTLLACQTACVPIAPVSYNCVSGNCVDPGNGLGLYPTLNACEVVCNPTPPVTPCVTDCELVIQAPLPGTTLVFSAYTITSTSSYTPLIFYNPSQVLTCNLQNIFSGSSWFNWGYGPLFPGGPIVDIPFTYTLNFSSPINNVYILLHVYSAIGAPNVNIPDAESFVFTTNAGFVDITCADYCCATITGGNTVTAMSGPGINCLADVFCIPGTCNGSGAFIISSSLPYTSLTITGSGGVAGINIGLCEAQFGTSNTSTIYTTFDALPIPAVSYDCVDCNCVSIAGPSGQFQTLRACQVNGCEANKFITIWETTTAGESITLPYYLGGTYAGTIDWGDSTTSANSFATSTHIYATPGIYTVTICGRITGWNFSTTSTSVLKIKSVVTWGQLTLGNDAGGYFNGCANLDLSSVTDTLDLFGTGITNFQNMFLGCTSLTTINNINFWNTSAIIGMPGMFSGCSSFNQPLSFDTSLVTDMSLMFQNCTAFNQSLTFNTSAVIYMDLMFFNCINFNQLLIFTNTSLVQNMTGMFQNCSAFNQALNFNTSSVQNMSGMFSGCSVFDQALVFNTGAVTNMNSMFFNAVSFNQPLPWNTGLVGSMSSMFMNATAFQQDISSWDISNVNTFTFFMSGKIPATWSTTYFDLLLCGWSLQTVNPNLTIDFGSANYTNLTGGPCYTVLQGAPNLWIINSGPGV